MKRTDIRAGVVYAVKASYGAPSPVTFLEDGAAGLYGRSDYGRGPIRKLAEDKYTRARRGSGFSESSRGYAAIKASWSGDLKDADAAEQMRAIDPEAELARLLAAESPSVDGLQFEIVTSLSQISGLYAEELAAYNARVEAERAAGRRTADARDAVSARIAAAIEALSAYGIRATGAREGKQVELSVDEAEKLASLLAAKDEA